MGSDYHIFEERLSQPRCREPRHPWFN
jgi:hypothetical protein